MTIEEIIRIVRNRLASLQSQRTSAVATGDLDRVASLDVDIHETQATLSRLLAPQSA
jgi:hypothetical protein